MPTRKLILPRQSPFHKQIPKHRVSSLPPPLQTAVIVNASTNVIQQRWYFGFATFCIMILHTSGVALQHRWSIFSAAFATASIVPSSFQYHRYIQQQQQRLRFLLNQWRTIARIQFNEHDRYTSKTSLDNMSLVVPVSRRFCSERGKNDDASSVDDTTLPIIPDWSQLIYNAYTATETDGIILLGTPSRTTCSENVEKRSSPLMGPLQELSPKELWHVTRQAAHQIATESQQAHKTKHTPNGNIMKIDDVAWKGSAVSMLHGWLAACSNRIRSTSVSNLSLTDQSEQVDVMIQYVQELFHIATCGEGIDLVNSSNRIKKHTATTTANNQHRKVRMGTIGTVTSCNNMTITPDLVTYALLYTAIYPINPIQAEYYLNLAIRLGKKMSGTKRRKLLLATKKKQQLQLPTASQRSNVSAAVPAQSNSQHASTVEFRTHELEILNLLRSSLLYNTNEILLPSSESDTASFVLHENENFVVVNKPSGICCYHTHVTTAGKRNEDISLVDALMRYSSSSNNDNKKNDFTQLSTLNPDAMGIVHRLDRGTSGCMVIAKNDPTHAIIVSNLFTRQILKTYTVLVSPAPSLELYNTTGYITIPVHGKPAKSMYTILERFHVVVDDCTNTTTTGAKTAKYDPMQHTNDNPVPSTRSRTAALLNVTTYTGRQHQVRVHCAYGLGTPIIGDDLYNNNHQHSRMTSQHPTKHAKKDHRRIAKVPSEVVPAPPERFHLHASSLYIPCIQETIYAPLPKWWIPILEYWRSYQPVNNNMTTSESG